MPLTNTRLNPWICLKMKKTLEQYLREKSSRVDAWLNRLLPVSTQYPVSIHKAMRYSLFAGGKRIRPALSIAAFEAFGGRGERIYPAACALEMLHTFSLIHDDLPCMDNDDFRRGKPTSHKVFGEAIAVLAGDALCIHAFGILGRYAALPVVQEIGSALGTAGMIGGQVVDIESEGKKNITEKTLRFIHTRKTEAFITASLRMGAVIAGAKAKDMAIITRYGRAIGLAFQIIDDILDIVSTTEQIGKDAGSDIEKGKATYPALFGLEKSNRKARLLIAQAKKTVQPLGARGSLFKELADFIVDRIN